MKRTLLLAALLIACNDSTQEPRVAELDQQNLLDGALGGQAIGRFLQTPGDQSPDHQSSQTFTVGIAGRLARVRVPLINNSAATAGATMDIVATTSGGVPDESQKLAEVTIPITAISTNLSDRANPEAWAVFDFTNAGINVTVGQQLALILRSTSTSGILYNPESTLLYDQGRGRRRNLGATTVWSDVGFDYGFQTFVLRN